MDCHARTREFRASRRALYASLLTSEISVSPGVTTGPDLRSARIAFADCRIDRFRSVSLEKMPGERFVQNALADRCGFFLIHHPPNHDPIGIYIEQSQVADILADHSELPDH